MAVINSVAEIAAGNIENAGKKIEQALANMIPVALDLLAKLLVAIRSASVMTFAVGIMVLAGAMTSGLASRIYDSVVLKTFGATRRQLILAYILEFAVLGLTVAGFSIVIGGLSAWAILWFVMEMEFSFSFTVAVTTSIIAMVITIVAGLATTWRVLGSRPARILRTQ